MRSWIVTMAFAVLTSSCATEKKETKEMNPFYETYSAPYGVPPFDKIENKHYEPAFREGMIQHDKEIEQIAGNSASPDYANTIEAIDRSGDLLGRVSYVFFNIKEANTNDSIDLIAEVVAPLLSQHADAIYMNEKLFARVKFLENQKGQLNLNREQTRLLEEIFKRFVRGGANLPSDRKEEFKKINTELSLLELKFGNNMLAETNNYRLIVDSKEDLAGLPESVVAAAADEARNAKMDGKWIFTLQKPSWIPFLTYSSNRNLREKLYKAMYSRSNNNNEYDNKAVINRIVNLRLKKANLLDFESWAAFVLDDCMAKNPKNVYDLIGKVWEPGLKRAKEEARDIQAMIQRDGGKFKLESWDWWYYSEKVRKEKYDLDEEQVRPYFELTNVREGAFSVANRLFGLTFRQVQNMPLYHPECQVFEVKDRDSSLIGIMYMDFFPRASKKGGAWMNNYRDQYHYEGQPDIRPVVSITCNFSKPTGDTPALLSYEEVETLFHEFGHGLHGLLSKCHYKMLSGTSVSRDFVELPSQVMEHWADQPEVLKMYARHYKTGEIIPQVLVDKIIKAGKFNQGFITTEFLAAAILDLDFHTITKEGDIDVEKFEKTSMERAGLIPEIIPRYRSTYFNHVFPGGYSSGYYSYIWAEVLDADAFEAYLEKGNIFDPAVAESFKSNILERGGTEEAMKLYTNFRGKTPGIEPLLKNRGLN
jgi:peptidyl-dipeptidase Dcp